MIYSLLQVTGESEGFHDADDCNETFRPATESRTSNVSSLLDKDQKGEGQGGEKVVSTLMSKNQSSDIASFERKFMEGNQREMRKDGSKYTESVANTGQKDILVSSTGTAMGKVETKPSEKSQPVVRGSSIDLQSKLRDLMKCGSSINTTNPFAPKRTEIPPPQQQQQQQQGNQKDCFIKCNVT